MSGCVHNWVKIDPMKIKGPFERARLMTDGYRYECAKCGKIRINTFTNLVPKIRAGDAP